MSGKKPFQHKPNTGSLFNNDRKETDMHPDRQGTINIDGREYWISGWDKNGTRGNYISLSVKLKDARAVNDQAGKRAPKEVTQNDDVPF